MREARRKGVNNRLFMLIMACGIGCGAIAFAAGFGVDVSSQVASGAAADAMCKGGPDAKCPCKTGMKAGKCDPKVKGGGKIGCPCQDVTSGDVAASGKCAAVGKCQADKADGMMPMLPMIPMIPMMMPMMEMPQDPCMQPGATVAPTTSATTTSTSATSSSTTPAVDPNANRNPNCPPGYGAQGSSDFWGSSVWNSVNPFASSDDTGSSGTSGTSNSTNPSVWKNLLSSLGISNDSESTDGGGSGTSVTSTTTGGVTSQTGTKGTTYSQTTDDFAKNGSTFSYQANPYTINPQAASILEQLKITLKKMLDVVKGML